MVAGVVAGAFLGLMADRWLGTKPWLLIVGFILGCGAAFLNVYRVAQAEDKRDRAERNVGSKKK
jgi:ATP synthase protein I